MAIEGPLPLLVVIKVRDELCPVFDRTGLSSHDCDLLCKDAGSDGNAFTVRQVAARPQLDNCGAAHQHILDVSLAPLFNDTKTLQYRQRQ